MHPIRTYTKRFHSIYITFSMLIPRFLPCLCFSVQLHVDIALSYQWEAHPQKLSASILRTLPCSATNSSERVTASWEMRRRCKAQIGKGTVSKTTQKFFKFSRLSKASGFHNNAKLWENLKKKLHIHLPQCPGRHLGPVILDKRLCNPDPVSSSSESRFLTSFQ